MAEDDPQQSQPTDGDRENARLRQEIAARQRADYDACLRLAEQAFGAGWVPSHRHYLVEKAEEDRCRCMGERPRPAATVFTARNDAGDRRHFVIGEDGQPREVGSYEDGFGPMLLEPDLGRTIEVRGEQVHPHRYSLCWAGYDLYQPRTAEQLAALRVSRERGREERADKKWAEENPLLAQAGVRRQDLEPEEGWGR
jgi:hypothetical protein